MKSKIQISFWVILIVMVLWSGSEPRNSKAELNSQFVPQLGPYIQIWDDVGDNEYPSVAYNPVHDEYLVVWVTKQDEFSWDIWGRRLRGDGSLIPGGWFNIDNIAGYHLIDPAVVYNPHTDQYLVVYTVELSTNDHDIWGKLVGWNGGLSNRFYIDNRLLKQTHPDVVYNDIDHHYLVSYCDQQPSGREDVYLRILDENGSYLGSATIASTAYCWKPDVAYEEEQNRYLVVYGNEDPIIPILPRILGRTVSADLSSLSPEFHYNDDEVIGYNPDISCNLDGCLVVWSGGFGGYVKARRVSHDGTPLGPTGGFEIAGVIEDVLKRNPSVSILYPWGYLVTWDYFLTTSNAHGDVYGRVVGFGKDQPMDGVFPVDNRQFFEGYSALACDLTGSCLLVDTHNPLEHPAGDHEISGRLVYTLRVFLPLTIR